MKKQSIGLALLAALMVGGVAQPASAAQTMYLAFNDPTILPDPAAVKRDPSAVAITSFTWTSGKRPTIPTSHAAAAKTTPESLSITTPAGGPSLFDLAKQGKLLPHVRIYVWKTGGAAADKIAEVITLSNVWLASDSWTGSQSDAPTETINLDYEKYDIVQPKMTGTLPTGWNTITNKTNSASLPT
jgi:type VI protein secretion system component Hcp